jgi:hypothetical protein
MRSGGTCMCSRPRHLYSRKLPLHQRQWHNSQFVILIILSFPSAAKNLLLSLPLLLTLICFWPCFYPWKPAQIRGSVFALSPNHPVHPDAPHLQSVSVHAPSAIAPQSVHEKLRNSASCPQISAQFGVLSSLNHYN